MVLKKYFQTALITCIHYLVNKFLHWTEKFFWMEFIFISVLCACLAIYTTISDYGYQIASYTVDTSFLEWETPFPSIIICETNNDIKIQQMQTEWFGQDIYINDKIDSVRLVAFYKGSLDNLMNFISTSYKVVTSNFSVYMKALRSKCQEVFSSCLYNDNEFECCDGFIPMDMLYGQCFTLNNKYAITNTTGKWFSITRKENYGLANLSIEFRKTDLTIGAFGVNEILSPMNLKQILINSFQDRGENNLFLKIIQVVTSENSINLPIKKRQCRYEMENNLKLFNYYSKSNCELECKIDAQKKYCNCFEHVLPTANSTTECNLQGLQCTIKKIIDIEESLKICAVECVDHCDQLEVYYTGSTKKTHDARLTFRNKNSKCRLNVLVLAPVLRYYRSVVKGPIDLLVSVCGALGLFLGCSIMTLVQFIYYLGVKPIMLLIYAQVLGIKKEQ